MKWQESSFLTSFFRFGISLYRILILISSFQKKQFSSKDILLALKAHKYLNLPRINTPEVFEDFCLRNTGTNNER